MPYLAPLRPPRLTSNAKPVLPLEATPCLPEQAWPGRAYEAMPACPCIALPCQRYPCLPSLPSPSSPDLAKPLQAMPATPSRLGRSDLSGPCLPSLARPGHFFRTMPAVPILAKPPGHTCSASPDQFSPCQACEPLPLRTLPSQPRQFMSAEGLPIQPPPPTQPPRTTRLG